MKFRESTDGSSSRQLSVIRRKSIIQAELSLSLSSGLAGDGHREKLGDSSISLSLSLLTPNATPLEAIQLVVNTIKKPRVYI
jgi:hypothetical protein